MVKFEISITRERENEDHEHITVFGDTLARAVLRIESAGVDETEEVTVGYWTYAGSRKDVTGYNPNLERMWFMPFGDLVELCFDA